MSKIRLTGGTSGYTEIQAADAAGNNVVTLPTTSNATILVSDSSGNVNIDSGTFYVDATNNRVGLGTSSPGYLLTVNGRISYSGAIGEGADTTLSSASTQVRVAESSTWQSLSLYTAGNQRLNIDSSGRVGIGSTSVTGGQVVINSTLDASNKQLVLRDATNGWARKIGVDSSNNMGFYDGDTERMRIDSSGRLLVGTSTTVESAALGNARFQVSGTSNESAQASISRFSNDDASSRLVFIKSRGSAGSNTIVQNGDSLGTIVFQGADGSGSTAYLQGAIITANVDGTPGTGDLPTRLVFFTTADGASSPTERMRINSGGYTTLVAVTGVQVNSSVASAGKTHMLLEGKHSGTAGVQSSGSTCFQLFTDGDVRNTNNSYGAISDAKLKENIVDANSQWDDLKALQVRNYNFKEGQTHTQIGLIAQEVELVSPGLVSESPDRDAEGNDLGTVTKSVNYSVLYMKAVKALQEAMERIETLEAKVAALEAS